MEYEKIKQLMDDMGNSKLTSISIDFPDGTKITMTKDDENKKVANATVIQKENENIANSTENSEESIEEIDDGSNIVTSPMVGTFYAKPSPTDEPYVSIGDTVKVGDTLCIVEAMKLMNEIESEYAGTITDVLVKDGDPVEFGTPLFKIK